MNLRNLLAEDEHILFRTKLHWIIYNQAILFFILSLIFFSFIHSELISEIFLFFGIISFIQAWVARKSKNFFVTDKRVLVCSGIVNVRTLEIFLKRIEGVMVIRPFIGRVLNFGTIFITGTGGIKIPLENIAHPEEFRETIMELQNSQINIE